MFDVTALQYNSENPTFTAVLLTVLFSFILSSLLAFVYETTSRGVQRPLHYIQTLILISIVASTVMLAIGDSLARGLGMLGALAIVRFRTTLKDQRNMAFMFAALAIGIACGVGGFEVSIVGTLAFCFVAVLLRWTPFSAENNMVGALEFEVLHESESLDLIEDILSRFCKSHTLVGHNINVEGKKGGRSEYLYHIRLKQETEGVLFVNELKNLEGLKRVNLDIRDAPEAV